ncbi:MAG: hypothetical protein E7052_07225 [Lentisphaerae bacterium]|nr:hypothetical protein [Lentisphaerota bacterium]
MENLFIWNALALGYLPGLILGTAIWSVARRSNPMPLFRADLLALAVPLVVWAIMYNWNWTLAVAKHNGAVELMLLGWIWSLAFVARLLIPRFTHKLRNRLAAIHVGSITLLAAILLALFFQWS